MAGPFQYFASVLYFWSAKVNFKQATILDINLLFGLLRSDE